MTDREQARRDLRQAAETMVAIHGDNAKLAHGVLALLAELEQAERTLSSVSATLEMVEDRLKQAERERDEALERVAYLEGRHGWN